MCAVPLSYSPRPELNPWALKQHFGLSRLVDPPRTQETTWWASHQLARRVQPGKRQCLSRTSNGSGGDDPLLTAQIDQHRARFEDVPGDRAVTGQAVERDLEDR
jgi:hypothetical protein